MTDAAVVALVIGVLGVMGWIIKNVFNAISANTIRIAQLEVKLAEVEKGSTRTDALVSKLSESVSSLDKTIHELRAIVENITQRRRKTDFKDGFDPE